MSTGGLTLPEWSPCINKENPTQVSECMNHPVFVFEENGGGGVREAEEAAGGGEEGEGNVRGRGVGRGG